MTAATLLCARSMNTLTALHAFTRVVETGSFTGAARELHVSQATVSKWVAGLEDELGVSLLDRTTRTMRTTDAGERLLTRARAMLTTWDSVRDELQSQAERITGRLRVAVPVVLGEYFVTPILASLTKQHPGLMLDVIYSDTYDDPIETGVDLSIRIGELRDSDYVAIQLASSPRRLVASPTYLARAGSPERIEDLAQHNCLLHANLRNRHIWTFEADGQRHHAKVSGTVTTNHSRALLTLAEDGIGIALLAGWLVDDRIADGRLVHVLPEYSAPSATAHALISSRKDPSPAARAFIEHVRGALQHFYAR